MSGVSFSNIIHHQLQYTLIMVCIYIYIYMNNIYIDTYVRHFNF